MTYNVFSGTLNPAVVMHLCCACNRRTINFYMMMMMMMMLNQCHSRISWSIFTKSSIEVTNWKVRTNLLVSTLHDLLPVLPPKLPKDPENYCKHKYANFCLKCLRIAGIPASYRKVGSRNTIVSSDFRPEVEIRQFRACELKNFQCFHQCIHPCGHFVVCRCPDVCPLCPCRRISWATC